MESVNQFHKEVEDELKQLYFNVIDKQEEYKEKLWHQLQSEEQDKNKEKQIAEQIILIERYYDIVADFAKTWGSSDKTKNEVPQEILAGADIVTEYLKVQKSKNLSQSYDQQIKEKMIETYQLNKEITQNTVEEYLKSNNTSQLQNEMESNIDKESNWENLSNVGDDDVVYLKPGEEQMFDLEGEESGEEQEYNPDENNQNGIEEEDEYKIEKKDILDDSSYQLSKHTSYVTRVAKHPTLNILASAGGDDVAIVWDLNKKEVLKVLPNMKETIDGIAFNCDGSLLATATLDGQLDIYSFKDNQITHLHKLEGIQDEITFIQWHSKGNAIIAGSTDGTAHLWNGEKGKQIASYFGHEDSINFGCFTPDGKQVVTASADKSVRIWNPQTGEEVQRISGYGFHEESVNIVSFHQKQQIMITGSEDKTVCISNYVTGKILGKTKEHGGIVDTALFTENLDLFVTGCSDGICRVFDLKKILLRDQIKLEGSINKLAEVPKKCQIVCSTNEGRVYMFDYRKPQQIFVLRGAGETIHDFTLNGNEGLFAACEDGKVRYFEFSRFIDVTLLQLQ
ncbi:WD40-repeat-containing domain [Pseudocohnilembus persalinus]|uniref:WD40-repeat-containing domain n=1 Tax=Pseudocohnilembus persalinus TaxID=266149 RepID=A0A0V0QXX0_PSEPJ|nr:WD40-repeat-containing domain [Pseudocohnilembus persalinus]|eukprot:KRX06906.1 WD40-repeat-containing domain [Pseudocohnilembus persalinus]